MLRSIFSIMLVVAMTACTTAPPVTAGGTPPPISILPDAPAPLDKVVIDDQAINFAFESYDTVLTLVDLGVATGRIMPGSPRALQVRGYLVVAKQWLNAAKVAQEAGSTTSYTEAFAKAAQALTQIKLALKGA